MYDETVTLFRALLATNGRIAFALNDVYELVEASLSKSRWIRAN